MGEDTLQGSQWEGLGWIDIDGATCAFGDATALGPEFQLPGPGEDTSFRVQDHTAEGLALIAYSTMDDGAIDVEGVRDGSGAVAAARMCATNDVDELTGTWRRAGELDIPSGKCLAADPFCSAKDPYRFEFDVAPGHYVAEVFDFTDEDGGKDCLALRIRKV